ncbi:hypothetical protein HQ945_20220 [Phyllobacterium sp. BT25]|uniref:Uncharacterized protein n=1 Tax=Phyllobacterium pellucidum TaxID=2740464 RepID=A0A849VUD3_9HYPH|nr:hypothetical protein [Phyllobacterium pellucidum]NTS33588.1 hypothetical protein [Phyllobacterium pellucidum]
MAFTDNCDIFASFQEDAFNAVIGHVRRQRPSLFNYASLGVIANPGLLCRQIDAHPVVAQRNNPLMTRIDPLQIPGTNFAMELAVQVTEAKIDFHPGKGIALPPELGKLAPQRFAMALGVCLGLGCPRDFPVDRLIDPPKDKPDRDDKGRDPVPPRPLPVRSLMCFCLEVFAVGGVRIRFYNGKPYLEPFLDRIEIVDIRPDELEAILECYLEMMLKLGLIPKLRILLERAPLEIIKNVVSVVVKPTPISAAVPNNPAIEDDQLKAFINLEVI